MLQRLVPLLVCALSPTVWACAFPPPQRVRAVYPVDGATAVPTSVRVRVIYQTGAQAQKLCGPPPGPPILRPAPRLPDGGAADGGLGDGGLAPALDGGVAGSWVRGSEVDPRAATLWELRAAAPLQPNTTYEILDQYPARCDCEPAPFFCRPQPFAVVSRFTTGAGPDQAPPTFSGLDDLVCRYNFCPDDRGGCCGPYEHFNLILLTFDDAKDDHLLGLRFYLRRDGQSYDFNRPLGPDVLSDPATSVVATAWDTTFTPGKYFVLARAFDSSGNEDANRKELSFVFPLQGDPRCRGPLDGGVPMDLRPAVRDLATAPDLTAPSSPKGGGCGCRVGGAEGGRGAIAVGLALLLILRRGRGRWRRGGRGAGT